MNVLAIETSTARCGVALTLDRRTVVERSIIEAHIHSEKLLTLVKDVLTEARIGMDKLDGVAVSIGPGSFTGLRIGLSSAKGLCVALDKPLATVPTFDAIASNARALDPGGSDIVIATMPSRANTITRATPRVPGLIRARIRSPWSQPNISPK